MKSLQLSEPHAIILVGIPGSGKSFFAEHFAETFNAPLISYANIRAKLFSKQHDERSETATVRKAAGILLAELLKTKQTIVFDGSTDTKAERLKISNVIESRGYRPVLLWVQTESNTAKARATKRTKDGHYLSDDEFVAALGSFMPPTKSENAIVISGKHTYASQLKIVLKRLTEARSQLVDESSPKKRLFDRHIAIR